MQVIRKLEKLSETLGVPPGALVRLSLTPEQRYERFTIPKRHGKVREIVKPAPDLMIVQKMIKRRILDAGPKPTETAMAFVPGRSIVDNARVHSNKAIVVKFDLKDFFPSVNFSQVFRVFSSFGLNELESRTLAFITTIPVQTGGKLSQERKLRERIEYLREHLKSAIFDIRSAVGNFETIANDPGDAGWLARDYRPGIRDLEARLTHDKDLPPPRCRGLPQGAPTSPQLANLVCRRLDQRLAGLARGMGFQFTRYADDLAFSSDDPRAKVDRLAAAVNEIVRDCGFELNDRKTVVMRSPAARRVTGLTVSGPKPRVPRATMRKIRAMIHQSERDPNFANAEQLKGFLSFVSMVNPEQLAQLTGGLNPSKTGTKTKNKAMTRTADSNAKKKKKGEVPKTSARSKAKKTS
jgi:RNA-directed DNA polymerase